MKKKLIITESQAKFIKENVNKRRIVKKIVSDLNGSYSPVMGTYRYNKEYHNTPMIKNKIDGDNIATYDLLSYLIKKYPGFRKEFIRRIVIDWYNDNINDDYQLSTNVKYK